MLVASLVNAAAVTTAGLLFEHTLLLKSSGVFLVGTFVALLWMHQQPWRCENRYRRKHVVIALVVMLVVWLIHGVLGTLAFVQIVNHVTPAQIQPRNAMVVVSVCCSGLALAVVTAVVLQRAIRHGPDAMVDLGSVAGRRGDDVLDRASLVQQRRTQQFHHQQQQQQRHMRQASFAYAPDSIEIELEFDEDLSDTGDGDGIGGRGRRDGGSGLSERAVDDAVRWKERDARLVVYNLRLIGEWRRRVAQIQLVLCKFVIGHQLVACAIAFVMWRNPGAVVCDAWSVFGLSAMACVTSLWCAWLFVRLLLERSDADDAVAEISRDLAQIKGVASVRNVRVIRGALDQSSSSLSLVSAHIVTSNTASRSEVNTKAQRILRVLHAFSDTVVQIQTIAEHSEATDINCEMYSIE